MVRVIKSDCLGLQARSQKSCEKLIRQDGQLPMISLALCIESKNCLIWVASQQRPSWMLSSTFSEGQSSSNLASRSRSWTSLGGPSYLQGIGRSDPSADNIVPHCSNPMTHLGSVWCSCSALTTLGRLAKCCPMLGARAKSEITTRPGGSILVLGICHYPSSTILSSCLSLSLYLSLARSLALFPMI